MHDHDDDQPPPDLHVVDPENDNAPISTHNLAAERALLGILLQYPETTPKLSTHLTSRDFYQPRHELVWDAAQTIAAADQVPDQLAIIDYLARTGQLQRAGGPNYLLELRDPTLTPHQGEQCARYIRDAARLRAAAEAADRIKAAVHRGDPTKVEQSLETAMDTIDAAVNRFGPTAATGAPSGLHDLSFLSTGQWPVIDPPSYGHRLDGGHLFYRARVNGLYGDPESAKTWIASWAMLEAQDDGICAIIDVDHNGPALTVARLALLGAKPEWLAAPDRFRYYEPEDASELMVAVDELRRMNPAFTMLDSVGEILPMMGVKSVDNDEISAALRRIANPLADAGACVVTIDHLPKSHEARSTGYAIGGTAKKRALDGSLVNCETRLPPSPGALGKITLRIEKDRPGELRRSCNGQKYIGDFILDSRDEHVTTAKIVRSDALGEDGRLRPTHLMESVSRLVEDMPLVTGRTIEKTIRGKGTAVRAAIQILLEEMYISARQGGRNSLQYSSLKPYRETDEDPNDDLL